jgi:hypothetical protein
VRVRSMPVPKTKSEDSCQIASLSDIEIRETIMSEILDIAHEMARDLFEVGAIDEITMREIEALCASIETAVQITPANQRWGLPSDK